jgi:peptidyl-prolyl cis-trans isomerase C
MSVKHYVWMIVLLLAATAACQRNPAPAETAGNGGAPAAAAPETTAPPPPPAPKPVPAELPPVVARVNGDEIGRDEFQLAVRNVEGRAGQAVPAEQRDEVYRGLLDDLVAFRLLKQEAERRQLSPSDADLNAAMKELRGQFPDEGAFKQALAAQKMTLQQLRQETRDKLLVDGLLEQEIGAGVTISPADISGFYEQHPERFQQPEAVRASHVLIGLPENADDAARNAARARAEQVLKQARAGTDFAQLARKHSNDASAQRGGDLGFFPRGQMVPPFEQAAFALQPGQISDVVETPFGYHVIKVTERQPGRTVPFSEVTGQIEQYLQQERRGERARAFIEQLKAQGNVEIMM